MTLFSVLDVDQSVAPEIRLPNRRIGQARGRETILECVVTANPQTNNYWSKNGHRLTSSDRYRIDAYDENEHCVTLSLRIRVDNDDDFGEYVCVASNSLGTVQQSMELYGRSDCYT